MRTEQGNPVRLEDYRPPDWLIETVELDVSLHPTATTVRATLKLSPNPAAEPAPIVLDGDDLTLRLAQARRLGAAPDRYVATPDRLTIAQPPAGPFYLQIETSVDPSANTKLMGLYRSSGTYCTQCEAEGFRRITYFPDRPDVMAVYTTRIEAEKREAAGPARQRQPGRGGRRAGTAATSRSGTIRFPKPSYLFALVGGDLGLRRGHVSSRCRAARSRCASMSSPARRTAAPMRWTRSSARCAGTRRRSAANTTSTSS